MLETFSDISEMRQAIRAVRELCDLPIVAQMTIMLDGNTSFGTTPEVFTARLDEWGADVIGLNCGVGPATVLTAVEKMRARHDEEALGAAERRTAARRAGAPVLHVLARVHGQVREAIHPGGRASFIGGCCGTTPAHIKLISDAVRAALAAPHGHHRQARRSRRARRGVDAAGDPGRRRSKSVRTGRAGSRAASSSRPSRSCRRKVATRRRRSSASGCLKEAGVDAVNIPDGPRAQTRMSAQATAVLVEREIGIEAVLHYCCRDRNLLGMMSDLLGAAALGLRNLLLITGDPPKMGPYPDATAVFDIDSIGLTNMVNKLNHGLDLGNNPIGHADRVLSSASASTPARSTSKKRSGASSGRSRPGRSTPSRSRSSTPSSCATSSSASSTSASRSSRASGRSSPTATPSSSTTKCPASASRPRSWSACASPPRTARKPPATKGSQIARESLLDVRDMIQGVQVSAPFNNVRYALEVFEALPEFSTRKEASEATTAVGS